MPVELSYAEWNVDPDDIALVKETLNKYDIDLDLVLSFGGDGAFLYAFRKYDKPILPIGKRDSVGFIADNTLEELEDCLEKMQRGEYEVQSIPKIDGLLVHRGEENLIGSGANDIYIKPKNSTRSIDYSVDLGYDIIEGIGGDGIIFFTPLGSTGYNRSVRGPKLDQNLDAFGMSQIAPGTSNNDLPQVYDANREVKIKINRERAVLSIDGSEETTVDIEDGDSVICRKSENISKLIRVNPKTVTAKIKRKNNKFFT